MSVIESLPGGGANFKAVAGAGSFKSRLRSVVKSSSTLHPLSENQEAIVKAVQKYETTIRQGKFTAGQRSAALSQIQKNTNIGASEKSVVKKILQRLGENTTRSYARINRADEFELPGAGLANQNQLANKSGMSGAAGASVTPRNTRPMVSVSQFQQQSRGAGMASNSKVSSLPSKPGRPPMMPLMK